MQKIGHHGVDDEFGIGTDFVAGKGGNAVNQECGRSFDISLQQTRKTAVDFQSVATIPVSASSFCGKLLSLCSEMERD